MKPHLKSLENREIGPRLAPINEVGKITTTLYFELVTMQSQILTVNTCHQALSIGLVFIRKNAVFNWGLWKSDTEKMTLAVQTFSNSPYKNVQEDLVKSPSIQIDLRKLNNKMNHMNDWEHFNVWWVSSPKSSAYLWSKFQICFF